MTTKKLLIQGYSAGLIVVAVWTGFILVSRLGGISPLTSYDILALRLTTASALLLPFSLNIGRQAWLDMRLWALAILSGLLYGLTVYAGFKHTTAAQAAILLNGLQPFLIAAFAWLLFRTPVSKTLFVGLVFISVGTGFIAWPFFHDPAQANASVLWGDGLIILATTIWAFYSVLLKLWKFDPWLLTRFIALSCSALYLPVYWLWLPKQLDTVPVSTLLIQGLYQGIGPSIIATLLFLKAVNIIGPQRMGAMISLVPVMASLLAVPLLGENLTVWLMLSLITVSLGAFIAAKPSR